MIYFCALFFRWGPRLSPRASIKEVSSKARHDVMGRALSTAPYLPPNQKSYLFSQSCLLESRSSAVLQPDEVQRSTQF